jgi:BASS family bile acid:Na+ symporter
MNPGLILVALQASMFLAVLSVGMGTRFDERWYLLRRPGQFARSLFSMNVVMPLLAVALAAGFDLHPAVSFALIALAVSPVAPLLPARQLKAGGRPSYVFGLLVAAAVLAIGFAPFVMHVSPRAIARLVLLQFLIPLGAGMALRHAAPGFAERITRHVSMLGMVLLLFAGIPLLFVAWPLCLSLIGNGTLAALSVFCAGGVMAGHLLGGPAPQDRTVLAMATAARHPAVAMAIAAANFPGDHSIFGALFLYLLVSAIITRLYCRLMPVSTTNNS